MLARSTASSENSGVKRTLIQRFGLFFYDHREATILVWVSLIVFGALSYGFFMKRQGFPAVDVPVSVVSGTYFVNDSTKVDQDLTEPFSEAITALPEVESVLSSASDNFFSIIVEFEEGTSSNRGTALIRQTIADKKLAPQAAAIEFKPVNAAKFIDEFDVLVSTYQPSGTVNMQTLETETASIAAQLEKHDGIARATVLRQYETGTNPQTGQQTTEKQHFDRLSFRQSGKTVFYPSVTVGIVGESGQDAIELSGQVEEALSSLSDRGDSEDIQTRISADFAENIEAQVSGLQRSLLEGLAVVLLVSFLLISWRASLTSALSMVTVLLITIGALYVSGNTLNTVTLFALILSLGLIVDDTTIKVEAIDAAKREHRRKREIIALAAKRVSLASVAGTCTTIFAFAPMLFVGGVLGDFIRILPVTIIISLALSLLVSLVLVPIIGSGIILRGWPKKSINPILKLERMIANGLARLLLVGKRSRAKGIIIGTVALLIGFIMVAASIPFFQKLKFDIFPATKDTNQIQINMRFPSGTTIAQAEARADAVNDTIGKTLIGNLRRVSYQNSGTAMETIATVDLINFEDREVSSPELVERLRRDLDDFQGAQIKVSQLDVGPPAEDLPFRLQIAAEDRGEAVRLAADIATFLKGREIERLSGTTAHVTEAEIVNSTQVTRQDGKSIIEVGAGFDADDTSALVTAAQSTVEDEFTPTRLEQYGLRESDLAFDFGTESENQESFETMLIAFPILLVAMYALMSLQFRSFLQPLLIFSAIPYSFFGVAAGLYITDNPLSFFVMVGFFALIGIAVNNTILLTDYANQARREGYGRIDAVAISVRARLRPLLTTSLTSIVALIPLALNDPFWEALSFTLIFGLLSSTFLVIITFPYVYLLGEGLRIFGNRLWHRQLPPFIQYPLDVLIAPARLVRFIVHIIFHHTY